MTPQQAATRFHYAFAISDIERAREFYVRRLGCAEGRSTDHWIDFELFGHQLSAHLGTPVGASYEGTVDGHAVPIPHFGAILEIGQFWKFAEQLRAAGVIDSRGRQRSSLWHFSRCAWGCVREMPSPSRRRRG